MELSAGQLARCTPADERRNFTLAVVLTTLVSSFMVDYSRESRPPEDARQRTPPELGLAEQTWRGGARIGHTNATWPFAQLKLTADQLVLKVVLFGTYVFKRDQVTKVEPYGFIPFAGKGVRIHHNVLGYPEKIIFWYPCINPQPIVDRLGKSGYAT